MLIALIELIAAFFEVVAIVDLERCGRHNNNLFFGFKAFGDGNGRARFPTAETVKEEEAAIRRVHVQIIFYNLLMGKERETSAVCF